MEQHQDQGQDHEQEDAEPVRGARPALRAGVILSGLALAALLFFSSTSYRSSPAKIYYRNVQPRLVAERGQLTLDEQSTVAAFKAASPSVVFITSKQVSRGLFRLSAMEISEDAGSGFIWDANGYIVTNYHVVQNSATIQVALADQSIWPAQRVGTDPDKDIAVLKIEAPANLLPPIPVGTSNDLRVGQRVYAVGNPFGYDQSMTAGIISGLGREIKSITNRPIKGVIQTDAPLNPGNSGGPLLDSAGRVIGMTTAILTPTGAYAGIGFAVPIDTINRIVPEIIRGEIIPRPRLGITTAEDHLARRLGLEGVLILEVLPDSTAEKAGLRETRRKDGKIALGDLIVAVDGESVRTSDDLFRIIDQHAVGDSIRLTVLRDSERVEVDVKLESMP
jgi:S1-C subfamily serine protease